MNAIEAGHLVKRFGTITAVNDVSLTVKEGEIFGFLGPNGAGKTTTMRLLTGVSCRTQDPSGLIASTSITIPSLQRCRWE